MTYTEDTEPFYRLLGSLYGVLVAAMIIYLLYRKCFRNRMLQKIQWILMVFQALGNLSWAITYSIVDIDSFSNCMLSLRLMYNMQYITQFTLMFIIQYKLYFVSKNVALIVLKGKLPSLQGNKQFRYATITVLLVMVTIAPSLSTGYLLSIKNENWWLVFFFQEFHSSLGVIFSIFIDVIIFLTISNFLKVREYRMDAGKQLVPYLIITFTIMILVTIVMFMSTVVGDYDVVLYADLARSILFFLLNCVFALKVPHAVCDLTFKSIAIK